MNIIAEYTLIVRPRHHPDEDAVNEILDRLEGADVEESLEAVASRINEQLGPLRDYVTIEVET